MTDRIVGVSPASTPRSLGERLTQRIRERGPMTFAEFMETALYDPAGGFYSRMPVGERGDFVTSPQLSSVFGALVATQVEEFWDLLGRPNPFPIVEVGAGDGTLAGHILASLPPAMAPAALFTAVDRSKAARESLLARGLETASSLEEVGPISHGCVLANELLDNLPFHWLRQTKEGLMELCVGLGADGRPVLVEGGLSRPDLSELSPQLGEGEEAVVSPAALAFVEQLACVLDHGYAWIVDYGFVGGEFARRPHAYRNHRLQGDVLAEPGSRDITAGIDFDAVIRRARDLSLSVWGPVTQRDALLALGFRDLDQEARVRQVNALRGRRGLEAIRSYSDRNRAGLLIAPQGLGGFFVVCLGVGVHRAPSSMRP